MVTIQTEQTIDPEFLSRSDRQFMQELVIDWLNENDITPVLFSYRITVEWEE